MARRLELDDGQRDALVEILREGAEARQALALQSRELRHDLMQAVRAESELETFEALLKRLEGIRERERAIERQEEKRLESVLDARQRAMFLIMRRQFNDRVRGMRGRGPARPGRPGGAGPGGPLGWSGGAGAWGG